jgi:F0F1-type ATP synthase assembly protein I
VKYEKKKERKRNSRSKKNKIKNQKTQKKKKSPKKRKKEAKGAHIVLALCGPLLHSAFVVLFQTQTHLSPLLTFIFGP